MDWSYILLLIFSSAALLLICLILLHRIRIGSGANKNELLSQGFRLTIYAGMLLSALLTFNDELVNPNKQDTICQAMQDLGQSFDPYFEKNCVPSVFSLVAKSLFSSALLALSWLIPLVFTGIGVGVMTSALLMPRTPSESDEPDFFRILPRKLRIFSNWFARNIS